MAVVPGVCGLESLVVIIELTLVTFALGVLLGFVGAGGAGLVVALLSTVFGLPIHEAIGTSLAAMFFTAVSGAISHHREGNLAPRAGMVVGVTGVIGAIFGAHFSQGIPERPLTIAAGLGLWFLAALVWIRTRYAGKLIAPPAERELDVDDRHLVPSLGLGAISGGLSALLGVGMSPFIQLGLLVVAKLPLRQAVGTTMLVLVFVSASAAATYFVDGDVSVPHLIGAVLGLSSGSFLGARFTGRAPLVVLRAAIVLTPLVAGGIVLLGA